MKVKEVKLIDESEFSELVSKTYGRPYRLQQHGNDGHAMPQDSIVFLKVPADDDEDCYWGPGNMSLGKWLEREPSDPMNFSEKLEWERNLTPLLG